MEGCFYTYACPAKLKFSYAQNLLRLGAKDWWNFVTNSEDHGDLGTANSEVQGIVCSTSRGSESLKNIYHLNRRLN